MTKQEINQRINSRIKNEAVISRKLDEGLEKITGDLQAILYAYNEAMRCCEFRGIKDLPVEIVGIREYMGIEYIDGEAKIGVYLNNLSEGIYIDNDGIFYSMSAMPDEDNIRNDIKELFIREYSSFSSIFWEWFEKTFPQEDK